MYPSQDTSHVAESLGYLIEQFKNAPTLRGFVTAFGLSVQELENVFWSVINARLLNASTSGDALTKIGKIVGELRNGRTDAQLLPAVQLRIRVNRSQGLAEDIIQIAALLFGNGVSQYADAFPAAWTVTSLNVASAAAVVAATTALGKASALGVRGLLVYSTDAAANAFTWNGAGFGDIPSRQTAGSEFVSGVDTTIGVT